MKDERKKDYERLDPYIKNITKHINKSYDAFREYCKIATEEEHLTPQEAWRYLVSKLSDSVIPHSTLYRWADRALPEGAKQITKPKAEALEIPTWESQEGKPDDKSGKKRPSKTLLEKMKAFKNNLYDNELARRDELLQMAQVLEKNGKVPKEKIASTILDSLQF